MFREKIPAKQASAWLFAAVTPPLIQLTAGMPWLYIAVTVVICIPGVYASRRWGKAPNSRLVSILHWLFLAVLAGALAAETAASWPVGDNAPAVPLILLALAAWSALKGPTAAARVGCVLFWVILIVYLIVFGAGVAEIDPHWLCSPKGKMNWFGGILLLTPAAAGILVKKEKHFQPRLILPSVFALTAAVICTGVLSPKLAGVLDNPFYEMTRSLNLLGVARRFEAIISAAMTAGWFSLLSLYLSMCGTLADRLHNGWGRISVVFTAGTAAAVVLYDLHIAPQILAICAAVFWVVTPLVTQGIGKIKKS